jgi:hypothetical protein
VWQRSPIGFDTGDRMLDVVIEDDGRWHYKDEDELQCLTPHHWGAEVIHI